MEKPRFVVHLRYRIAETIHLIDAPDYKASTEVFNFAKAGPFEDKKNSRLGSQLFPDFRDFPLVAKRRKVMIRLSHHQFSVCFVDLQKP